MKFGMKTFYWPSQETQETFSDFGNLEIWNRHSSVEAGPQDNIQFPTQTVVLIWSLLVGIKGLHLKVLSDWYLIIKIILEFICGWWIESSVADDIHLCFETYFYRL
jgi:hypothetical protein